VADHPQIKLHLQSRVAAAKVTTILYGADAVSFAPVEPVQALGLEPGRFMTLIARAEAENSLLEIVQGFSAKPRGMQLVVLGNYQDSNAYHRAMKAAASDEVRFVSAIYDKTVVQALRFHSAAYVHGHQVGGTNPSLVEALGAGNAVVAHDNRFNRWVAGDGAVYFDGTPIAYLMSYLTRLPFPQDNGATRYCVAGDMTDDPDADFKWTVDSPAGKVAPTYCVDCLGELGAFEQVYGPGAQKCRQCGSVFLLHALQLLAQVKRWLEADSVKYHSLCGGAPLQRKPGRVSK